MPHEPFKADIRNYQPSHTTYSTTKL